MIVLFFISGFLATITGTIAGFGVATILLPVALLFFEFKTALVLVALMHLFGSFSRVSFFKKGVNWKMAFSFGIPGLITSIGGAMLVVSLNQAILQAALGVFLILYAAFAFIKPDFKLKASPLSMLTGGAASGFLAGLIGTGGALRSVFLTAYRMPKESYIATSAALALTVDGIRIPVYLHDGMLSATYYWMLPILFILAVFGALVGKRIATRIPNKAFGKFVLFCLLLIGIKLVFDAF
jgi:uncharacterized membrane protein YfcA